MATNTVELMDRLKAPFSPEQVHFRVGPTSGDKKSGIALAYIDARDAQQRLDEVIGPQNWQRDYPWSVDNKICCRVGIKCDGEWIWKADGAGETNMESEKGAFSDSFKRACVNWGIAQYLYDLPNAWFPIKQQGKSYVFTDEAFTQIRQRFAKWQSMYFEKHPIKGVN